MRKSQLAVAVATAMGATAASAANVAVDLISITSESSNGSSASLFGPSTTATWSFNTSSGVVSGTGTLERQTQISPSSPGSLFTHYIDNLSIGGGGSAGATSYSCVDGLLAPIYGAGYCGNYNAGSNGTFESSVSYGPGTAFSKTVGGDDANLGPQQSILAYDGMTTSWNGTTLVISNAVPGVGGQTFTFTAQVPVPAAVWLFGSALGLLGWVRRRATA